MKRLWPLAILLALADVALARPGGGNSFSGGGGHYSGGGGHYSGGGGYSGGHYSSGGDGGGAIFELIYWLFRAVFYYPQIGVPVLIGVIGLVLWSAYQKQQNKDWDSGPPVELERAADVAALRGVDPDFSQVVFEDFVFRLFSTAHRARTTAAQLATIAPYVSPAARQHLAERAPVGEPVLQVIVGALRVFRIDLPADPSGQVRLAVELEANVATAKHTYYSVETWLLARDASRHSKPPGRAHTFPCPNCGAPWQASASGTQVCASCGQAVDNGRFDWVVEDISLSSIDERPPSLTEEVPERGTDLPTYTQPSLGESWNGLVAADPATTFDAVKARLAMIYGSLNHAWSENQLAPVRGLVSDGLFDYLQYWIDAYKREGLRNALLDMRITQTALAKVSRDKYYDALTIRVWGSGKDFVVRSGTDEVVRGSKHRELQAPRARIQRVLDADPHGAAQGRSASGSSVRQLRRAATGWHGRCVRALRCARHRRRVRLGALEDRAGRYVSRLDRLGVSCVGGTTCTRS
jgi:hypothetical protein